jgi:hypothetical protein
MITYGSLRPLPAVVRAPGLRGSSGVWGARLGSGEDCVLHLLVGICVFVRQKCPNNLVGDPVPQRASAVLAFDPLSSFR